MKRNIYLLIVLIVLGGLAWWVIDRQNETGNKSYDFSYREFAIEDLSVLDKIVVTKRNAEPRIFTRKNDSWMLNGEFIARKNAVDNMLDVIKNIQIDYVPPNSANENIMKSFLRHGIKVELYDKKGEAIKKYYVGSSPADGMGSYFVMDGYDKPIVMSLPTMKGNVHTRFNYKFNEWRDMTVLDINATNIKEVKVSYPFNKKFSFKCDGNSVYPLHDLQKPIAEKVNKSLVNRYFKGFEDKVAEYIENENPKRDSIITQVPFCEVEIILKKGDTKQLQFFYYRNKAFDQTQPGEMDAFSPYHVERFFIESNWGDFYLGQFQVFKDIFWKYDAFYANN